MAGKTTTTKKSSNKGSSKPKPKEEAVKAPAENPTKKKSKRKQDLDKSWGTGYDSGRYVQPKLPRVIGAFRKAISGFKAGLHDGKEQEKIDKNRSRGK